MHLQQLTGALWVASKLLPNSKVLDIDLATTRCTGATQKMCFSASGPAGPEAAWYDRMCPSQGSPSCHRGSWMPLSNFGPFHWPSLGSNLLLAYRALQTHL